jgi:hypothetical protein
VSLTTDYEGKPVPTFTGRNPSIGAYEYRPHTGFGVMGYRSMIMERGMELRKEIMR